jgi:hypothetical protein
VKKAEKAKGFPEYGELIRRAREVQEIYRKNGLTRCT